MINYLRSLINSANESIKRYEANIKKANDEIEICRQLIVVLTKIESDASEGGNFLNSAANSLNAGIKIGGVGQGEKIFEKASKMLELQTNSETGITNVKLRIVLLEANIKTCETMIKGLNNSISGWSAEIERLEKEDN